MKIFIFDVGDGMTDNYHSGGAALVVACDLDRARILLYCESKRPVLMSDAEVEEWAKLKNVFETSHIYQEQVIFFPDAGCC